MIVTKRFSKNKFDNLCRKLISYDIFKTKQISLAPRRAALYLYHTNVEIKLVDNEHGYKLLRLIVRGSLPMTSGIFINNRPNIPFAVTVI